MKVSAPEEHPTTQKALVVSEIYPPTIGGSGRWLHDIYSAQPVESSVLLVGDHPNASTFDESCTLNIRRASLSTSSWTLMTLHGLFYFIKLIIKIVILKLRHKTSQIHCARVIPEGLAGAVAAKITRAKLICFVHGEDVEIARHSREHSWMAQRVLSAADRIVCNCEHSKNLLKHSWQVKDNQIRVLHPGIDTSQFHPAPDRAALREELGWHDHKVIFTASRLDERKGHATVIRALPEILKQVPNALYVIVGGGSPEQLYAINKLVSELGLTNKVQVKGVCPIEQMIHYYQACDLFVLANRQIGGNLEGFGIVLLEAQACGRPVIAGDSGGTRETMYPEKTGLLVDCSESENLVGPVTRLLLDEELARQMGEQGRALMCERFDLQSTGCIAALQVFL